MRFRFALTASGELFQLCTYTGSAIYIDTPESIREFIITATNDDAIEILALTENSSGLMFLKVFDYPSE